MQPHTQEVSIEAQGAVLTGKFYQPQGAPRAHLVIHGATGVPQRYYDAFANWAAERGVGVLTYDYRDFGASQRQSPRHSNATMADWGIRDQAAAERRLSELAPDGPLWALGHSLGGLTVAFRRFNSRFERFITIGAGHAHYSDHPWSYRPLALAFWFGPGPLATALAGYLPGRLLGLGPDLPKGVYWQWRRWCTTRGFYTCDAGRSLPMPEFRAYDGPMKLVAVADDQMVPPAAVWRLMQSYPEAQKRQLVLHPGDHGLPRIGHIGAFHRKNAVLWPEIMR